MGMEINEIVKLAAAVGAKAAINHLKERRKVANDRRLYNTRLLLENYTLLYDHCRKSIDSVKHEKIKEGPLQILDKLDEYDKGIYIESIKQSTVRTYIIVKHVDEMLDLFKLFCERTKNMRRYDVAVKYYFEGKRTEEIAMEIDLKKLATRTIQRDLEFSIKKLSTLIFGIDGLSSAK